MHYVALALVSLDCGQAAQRWGMTMGGKAWGGDGVEFRPLQHRMHLSSWPSGLGLDCAHSQPPLLHDLHLPSLGTCRQVAWSAHTGVPGTQGEQQALTVRGGPTWGETATLGTSAGTDVLASGPPRCPPGSETRSPAESDAWGMWSLGIS